MSENKPAPPPPKAPIPPAPRHLKENAPKPKK